MANNPINFVDPFGLARSGGQGNVGAGQPGGWNVGTRLGGVVQAVGSAAGLVSIAAATGTTGPVGFAIAVASAAKLADSFVAGLGTALTGQHQDSGTSRLLQSAGVPPTLARIIDTALDVTAGVGAVRTAAGGGVGGIVTEHGIAIQDSSAAAQRALGSVRSGSTVYRQGSFGVQKTSDAQFWSFQNPATTPGFIDKMGMPGGAAKPDWMMGGAVLPKSPVITRPAPGIGANIGGDMEAVTAPSGVRGSWFHMTD